MIYELCMTDRELSCEGHKESFCIGFFTERLKAEKTAQQYLKDTAGFKDYDIGFEITEKEVIGAADSDIIYMVYGWNVNESGDETDITESICFTSRCDAQRAMEDLKKRFRRREWCISRYTLNECLWQEGFVRA